MSQISTDFEIIQKTCLSIITHMTTAPDVEAYAESKGIPL